MLKTVSPEVTHNTTVQNLNLNNINLMVKEEMPVSGKHMKHNSGSKTDLRLLFRYFFD